MKKKTLVRFGRKIRNTRENQGFSQEELASKAGVHRTYIGMVERGEKNITLMTMKKIASALETRISSLLKDIEE